MRRWRESLSASVRLPGNQTASKQGQDQVEQQNGNSSVQRSASADVTGIILAGGKAMRMGGVDKGLVSLAGRPMVEHIIERLRPQTRALIINANRSQEIYANYGLPVVADSFGDFAGPLAGMASGLAESATDWVVTVPCDSPLLPPDLVTRLWAALQHEQAELAVAWAEGRLQPVFALLPKTLLASLRDFLAGGERKIDRWYARHRMALADFSDSPDTFLNVNTPDEREALEARLAP
jgi:molybdopterin-guanine dinucleotide biosynthesis protein A